MRGIVALLAFWIAVAAWPVGPRAAAGASVRVLPAAPGAAPVPAKCAPRLAGILRSFPAPDTVTVWIFFADRRPDGADRTAPARACLSPRAAARRLARSHSPYDERDLPVSREYINALRPHLARLRHASRYFNAVSALVASAELEKIAAYPFVARVDAVAAGRVEMESPAAPGEPFGPGRTRAVGGSGGPERFLRAPPIHEYGPSIFQLDQAFLTALLDKGVNGSGLSSGGAPVLIGILDTGFNRSHEALSHVVVEAEHDFVNDDAVTRNQPGDPAGQDFHGTEVLGVIAGRAEGELIGPAYGAHFALAKTEIVNQEIILEEDHWVAGIEWADSLGADVVSSSLGYIDWYTSAQLDGRTALSTRAAGIAVSHGIVVVNSAGNRGTAGLIAPADGDSVLSIGAVDRFGAIAAFSSRGPTADGRIKPDFVAMGVSSWTVSPTDTAGYNALSGTSFSAPLFAGGAALLLELHPDWSPIDLSNALRATSSNSGFPNNTVGWGIPDFVLAAAYPRILGSLGAHPNPFRDATSLQFSFSNPEVVSVKVYDVRGSLMKTLIRDEPRAGVWRVTWNGTNEAGREVAAGVYFIRTVTRSFKTSAKVVRLR